MKTYNIASILKVSLREALPSMKPMAEVSPGRRSFASLNHFNMKTDKIIYWVATGLLAAGMTLSSFMYLTKSEELIAAFQQLGYPLYFMSILGFAKLVGAITLVAPLGDRLKEWAYAGFLFTFGGAIWTHIATGTPWVTPAVFLGLLALSYFFYTKQKSARQVTSSIAIPA
jgi:hypothetical protein